MVELTQRVCAISFERWSRLCNVFVRVMDRVRRATLTGGTASCRFLMVLSCHCDLSCIFQPLFHSVRIPWYQINVIGLHFDTVMSGVPYKPANRLRLTRGITDFFCDQKRDLSLRCHLAHTNNVRDSPCQSKPVHRSIRYRTLGIPLSRSSDGSSYLSWA